MINSNYFSYSKWTKFLLFTRKPIVKNLYRGFIPKLVRKKFESFVDNRQQIYTAKHFRYFIELYFKNELFNFTLEPLKKELVGEKIIWQYWAQGVKNCPPIVSVCFSSVEHFKGEYKVIRLDDDNISEYLTLPKFIFDKKYFNSKFKHAFFADLIRLALLDVYGGVWLDATVFLTAPLPDNLLNMDYFMFYRDPNSSDKARWIKYDSAYFNWKESHKVNVLNSIIISKQNNTVIHTLLDLLMNFWFTQDSIPHYFFFQIMYDELMNNEFIWKKCKIIDDTLPHLLHIRLNDPFNPNEFETIKERIGVHKLRYINKINQDSYIEHIMNEF